MIGVKYTTARSLAERVVDLMGQAGARVGRSISAVTPLPGARNFRSTSSLIKEIEQRGVQDADDAADLAIAYGTRYPEVLERCGGKLDRASILDGRARFAVREEMAARLSDILYRRLDWLPRGLLSDGHIGQIADAIGEELAWDENRKTAELDEFHRLETQPIGPCR